MTGDVSLGERASPPPDVQLNKWQKRQATLLYHFASMEYLVGQRRMVDDFVKGVDVTLDIARQQGRDRLLVTERWGVRDTVENFNTYGFPALQDFRRSIDRYIARRATDFYGFSGYNQCARLLGELSMNWSTPDEEKRFEAGMEVIGNYSDPMDKTMRHVWTDELFDTYWKKYAGLFPRVPRFKVHTDIAAESGALPSRTGVYVPQGDPNGSLQFAWTGNDSGRLPLCATFNSLGLQAIDVVGRDALWDDDPRLLLVVKQARYIEAFMARRHPVYSEEEYLATPSKASVFIAVSGIVRRPCKWYCVERVEGEFDEPEPPPAPTGIRLRALHGEVVPATGWWSAIALSGDEGYRRFEAGDRFPETAFTAIGQVIWNFDSETQPASEREKQALELARTIAWTGQRYADADAKASAAAAAESAEPAEKASAPEVGAAAKPSPSSPATAHATQRVPLGELASTGRTCSQTGWWESIDEGDLRGGRRFLNAGDLMPYALVRGKPTLWQRMTNKRPTARSATVWKLVAYDEPTGSPGASSSQSGK